MSKVRSLLLIATLALPQLACAARPAPVAPEAARPAVAAKPAPGSAEAQKRSINANRAMQYLKEIVAFGPRADGSQGMKKQQQYLRAKLKDDHLEEDVFTADTPAGKFEMRNLIAKFPGSQDGIIVVASHYDTLYSVKNFVGANDGGSSTALLLELANQLRGQKLNGPSVWLVFFDGEEAFRNWTSTDSVYGSRHLAARWQQDGTNKKIKAFLLADMIGDADLNIDRDQNSTKWLQELVYQAASNLGYQSHFYERTGPFDDDHIPFGKAGVPVVDLIDLNYGYGNVFWHTPQDTIDKISPKSLQITRDTILETIRLLDERK